jgi:hypothetical protein
MDIIKLVFHALGHYNSIQDGGQEKTCRLATNKTGNERKT